MKELKQLRDYTSKTYQQSSTERKSRISIGPLHYNNKLGLGDGKKGMREVGNKIIFNEVEKYWEFPYQNYISKVPEYSDGWVEFRNVYADLDETIKYKAVVKNRVKGVLHKGGIEGLTRSWCLVYPDTFGEGIDLILIWASVAIQKIVRITDSHKQNKEYKFKFEFDFSNNNNPLKITRKKTTPTTEEIEQFNDLYDSMINQYEDSNKLIKELENQVYFDLGTEYELNTSSNKNFDTNRETHVGSTIIKPYYVWDSGEDGFVNKKIINVNFIKEDNTYFLEKIISKEFIEKSVGSVFTDAITSVYINSNSWGLSNSANGNSWSWHRDRTTAGVFDQTNALGMYCRGWWHLLRRPFLSFTKSSDILDGTVASVDLKFKVRIARRDRSSVDTFDIKQVPSWDGSGQPASSDYNVANFGSRYVDSYISYASYTDDSNQTVSLNSTAVTDLNNDDSYFKFVMQMEGDYNNSFGQSPFDTYNWLYFYDFYDVSPDEHAPEDRPYIEVTYTPPPPVFNSRGVELTEYNNDSGLPIGKIANKNGYQM